MRIMASGMTISVEQDSLGTRFVNQRTLEYEKE